MVEIKPSDLQNVSTHYEWNNDRELNYYDSEYPHKYESFESFLMRIKSVIDEKNQSEDLFEIHIAETGRLIGIVDIHGIDLHNQRCYVNCTIGDRNFTRKGKQGMDNFVRF